MIWLISGVGALCLLAFVCLGWSMAMDYRDAHDTVEGIGRDG